MTKDLKDLIDQYLVDEKASTMTRKEKARRRRLIWEAVPTEERQIEGKDARTAKNRFFHKWLNCPKSGTTERDDTIFSYGDAADPLWELIEGGEMSAGAAKDLLQTARREFIANERYDGGKPLKDYVNDLLKNGVKSSPFRRGSPTLQTSTHRRKDFESSLLEQIEKELKTAEASLVREARLWAKAFAFTVNQDVNSKINSFKRRIGSQVMQIDLSKEFTRAKVASVCKALHVDPPRPGQAINMEKAKANRLKLISDYHPDHNQDQPPDSIQRKSRLLDELNTAWDVAKEYFHFITGKEYV
jgi:hypothetical protein